MNFTAILAFAKGAFSGGPPGAQTPSASRTLLAVVVIAGVAWLTGDLIWQGISANWVAGFGVLAGCVSGGYAMGKFADRAPPKPPES